MERWVRLGDILVEERALERGQIEVVATAAARQGKRLGQVLVELGLASEVLVAKALARQLRIPFYPTLADRDVRRLAKMIPEHLARQCKAVPVDAGPEGLVVALWDPTDRQAVRLLENATGLRVVAAAAPFSEILEALEETYEDAGQSVGEGLRRQKLAHDMILLLGRYVRVALQETTGRTFLKLRGGGEILDLSAEEAQRLFADLTAVAREHERVMAEVRKRGTGPEEVR